MTEPTFIREGTSDLYWTDPTVRIAAFLSTDAAALGPRATLTQTWQDHRGIYVFLGAPAGVEFPTILRQWVDGHGPQQRPRFVWIQDPGGPPAGWPVTELRMRGEHLEGGRIPLDNYSLLIGDCGIAPGLAHDGTWGFILSDPASGPGLTFCSPTDQFAASPNTTLLNMEQTGGWRFQLDLPFVQGDVFARLGAEIRYFTPGVAAGSVNTLRFAPLRQPSTPPLRLYARVDPLRPLDTNRTSLSFFQGGTEGPLPALPSGFATAYGHTVSLQPLASARFVFAFAPQCVAETILSEYYLVPDGSFGIGGLGAGGTDVDAMARVICGASGLEYLGFPDPSSCRLSFVPDSPAFAPMEARETAGETLTMQRTTAWVRVEPAAGTSVRYYSQPEDAPLFGTQPTGQSLDDQAFVLLHFLETPAAELHGDSSPDGFPAFPMVPFRGIRSGDAAAALALERAALAPRRRRALLGVAASLSPAVETASVGITPQGLGVGLAADGVTWTWLGIGHLGDASSRPDLKFTRCDGPFQEAMKSNNLFLVLGNAVEFSKHGSVAYCLTADALDVIAGLPDEGGVRKTVLDQVRSLTGLPFETRDAFCIALAGAAPDIRWLEQLVFLRYGGLLTPVVGGWSFRLAPDNWGAGTYLILKFALGQSIAALVDDLSTWAWPEVAGKDGNPVEAQAAITEIIAAAVAEPATSPYADFAAIVTDPNWTGVLALSAEVPLSQLPSDLQVLSAGIDPLRFHAHHLGLSVTPYRIKEGQVAFERSSLFGLIDYQNPEDQYFSENVYYSFRVQRLTVGIRNSVVTTFASRAQLLVNRLFGTQTRLLPTTHGNNIILDGALQRQQLPDGSTHDTYVFSMSGQNLFQLDGPVLLSVELLSTQLVTAKATDPTTENMKVDAVFVMGGNLRFFEPEGFDPFCWGAAATGEDGYLRFGNLGITMSFALGNPAKPEFRVLDDNLSLDVANSQPRSGSLVKRFPIRLTGLIATADPAVTTDTSAAPLTPADLGYVSITAPIEQSTVAQPWYGLEFAIDLGTLGALASSQALALQVLVTWSPGESGTEKGIYLGVKLPGAKDLVGVSLPLQGVVKMGFKSIEFLVDDKAGAQRSYTLRMRDFALRLLALSFPPGHNDVILFGNPDQSGASKVGWYVAYASDSDPKQPPALPTRDAARRARTTLRSSRNH